jgi:hypothetical protein
MSIFSKDELKEEKDVRFQLLSICICIEEMRRREGKFMLR